MGEGEGEEGEDGDTTQGENREGAQTRNETPATDAAAPVEEEKSKKGYLTANFTQHLQCTV